LFWHFNDLVAARITSGSATCPRNMVRLSMVWLIVNKVCTEYNLSENTHLRRPGKNHLHQYLFTSASGRGFRYLNLKSAQPVRIDKVLCVVLYLALYLFRPIALISKVCANSISSIFSGEQSFSFCKGSDSDCESFPLAL
jgi:hypothetical protein